VNTKTGGHRRPESSADYSFPRLLIYMPIEFSAERAVALSC